MKILFVITKSEWGGAQSHLYELVKDLKSRKHVPVVIVGEDGELKERLEKINVRVIILKSLIREVRPIKDVISIIKLKSFIKRINPDLIHLHSSKAGLIGRISGRLVRKPIIFTAHGWAFTEGTSSSKRGIYILVERFVGGFTDKIICVSEFDRQIAIKNNVAPEGRLITVHNGVENIKSITHKKKSPNNIVPKIIMVARFSPQKDYKTLVEALSKVEGKYEVLLVGEGELLSETQSYVRELNLTDKVHFLGMRKDIPELLDSSDIFVLSTNYEGLPLSIIEAMSKKLPVIATDVGGVSELIEQNLTGILVKNRDANGLAENIDFLIKNPKKRVEMGNAGFQKYSTEFSLQNMLTKTHEIYTNILYK
ncbi:glycosyltransferase family 4 protein [Fictibacillus halophilus]|uniref:glycosyltransferase family 4 protein n=1 Tax=Fictibacillus halophilus TaxID=1610490 RepID=UPI0036283878